MAETSDTPILNPILTLQLEPRPLIPPGRGKESSSIVESRLQSQRVRLAEKCEQVFRRRGSYPAFAGKVHLVASMFKDSLAPSYTPHDLFNTRIGCQLVAPLSRGYLLETTIDQVPQLVDRINEADSVGVSVDISRVEDINAFDRKSLLRGNPLDILWDFALQHDEGKLFTIWLVPFRSNLARDELLEFVEGMSSEGVIKPVYPILQQLDHTSIDESGGRPDPIVARSQSSIARAIRSYRNTGLARATVAIEHYDDLKQLVASGTAFRIDPVKQLSTTTPNESRDFKPSLPDVSNEPIVAVIDGGLTSPIYKSAEAWAAPPFVTRNDAATEHGNQVSSLVVHGHQWNSNLSLPNLNCRIGTIQAVPDSSARQSFNIERLPDYLRRVAREHPETKVWNMSANLDKPEEGVDVISDLGDTMSQLARSQNILPVVSVGNVSPSNRNRLCGPADSEAALVVGGRLSEEDGSPGHSAPYCLQGPGPDGMLKPDLSWFSELRMIGDVVASGSSFATPLVAVLAAHTFANLKEPTPDLVRALLINASEQRAHDAALGWGTPYQSNLPWNCAPGSVTLVWTASLRPGVAYYWHDIPIPNELIQDGKLSGCARLTAILKPLTSPFCGSNYFASRLQTALQYQNLHGNWCSLLGSMNESSLSELEARRHRAKWHPIRRVWRDFSQSSGLGFSGTKLRLYCRVFTRDLYQFDIDHQSELDAQEAVFVLTLIAPDGSPSIYNTMFNELGNFVESAVVGQEIDVEGLL